GGKACGIEYAHVRQDGGGTEAEGNRVGSHAVVGGTGVEGVEGKLADKEVLGEAIIVHAPPGAKHRPAVAAHVPCQGHPGPKIVPIFRIELLDRIDGRRHGIEKTELVLLFSDHAEVLPAQAVGCRQTLRNAEVVLDIDGMIVLKSLAGGIALGLASAAWDSGDEIIQIGERQPAAIGAVEESIHKGPAELIAELKVVPAGGPGEVIKELPVGIRAPARDGGVGAQGCKRGADSYRDWRAHGDLGQPKILSRSSHIKPNAAGIEGIVFGQEVLMKPSVTEYYFRRHAPHATHA